MVVTSGAVGIGGAVWSVVAMSLVARLEPTTPSLTMKATVLDGEGPMSDPVEYVTDRKKYW